MENRLPKKINLLAAKAGEMAHGAGQYGGTIPLAVVTQVILLAHMAALRDAIKAVLDARKEVRAKRAAVQALIDVIRVFLASVRDHWKSTFGLEYNSAWDVTGFIGFLAIPKKELEVVALLHSVKAFLTGNAAMELESKGITLAATEAFITQLETARGAVTLQKKLVDDMTVDRDAKVVALRKAMRDMIAELKSRLTPLDSRWVTFGLNKPGAPETPDVPTNVVAILIGSTSASVQWGASARADYYRVWIRTAVDQPWVQAGNPADLDFTVEELLRNTKTEIAVSAVNDGGESALSAITSVTTLP